MRKGWSLSRTAGARDAPLESRRGCSTVASRLGAGALLLALLSASLTALGQEQATERVVWEKVPIAIVLAKGAERIVHFPGPVRLGLPARLEPLLEVLSLDGTLYLRARETFPSTRILVRASETGRSYLLDVSAVERGGSRAPVRIHDPEPTASLLADREQGTPALEHGYVALTRFASQQLYAPLRLLRDLPGVVRVSVERTPVALVRGGSVSATPLVSWRSGNRHVTAVKLVNQTSEGVVLDPRALRGAWLAATFQHARLLPAGDEADTTAVYLISARPFETAVR